MNGLESGNISVAQLAGVILTLAALLAFGWWYDRKVSSLSTSVEGFTWLQVVIGCFVTLIGMGVLDLFLDWNAFFVGLLAFAASGFFMVVGDIRRYVQMRERHIQLQKELSNDTSEEMAE